MSQTANRLWFRPRYSLATLLIVVTIFGCWLGYSLKWIQDRREFLSQPSVSHFTGRSLDDPPKIEPTTAPGLLWLLGEEGTRLIFIYRKNDDGSADQREREAKRLFPEAGVVALTSPSI